MEQWASSGRTGSHSVSQIIGKVYTSNSTSLRSSERVVGRWDTSELREMKWRWLEETSMQAGGWLSLRVFALRGQAVI